MDRRTAINLLAGTGTLLAGLNPLDLMGSEISLNEEKLKSVKAKKGYLETDYGQVFYWTAGEGPNLVLIHQSSNSSDEYLGLIPLLSDHYRLIAMDLPGHGKSDNPIDEPTVEDYCAAIINVMHHLNIKKTHMLGHHGGALAAIYLKAMFPEKFEKVILSGTGGIPTRKSRENFIQSLKNSDRTITKDNTFIAKKWDRYVTMLSDGANPEDILKPFIAYLDAIQRPHRGIFVNLKWDRTEYVHKLKGPVLLVQGTKDQYVSNQESLLEIIPDSSRVEMPGCGTFVFYDRPDLCAELIRGYLD